MCFIGSYCVANVHLVTGFYSKGPVTWIPLAGQLHESYILPRSMNPRSMNCFCTFRLSGYHAHLSNSVHPRQDPTVSQGVSQAQSGFSRWVDALSVLLQAHLGFSVWKRDSPVLSPAGQDLPKGANICWECFWPIKIFCLRQDSSCSCQSTKELLVVEVVPNVSLACGGHPGVENG